MQTIFHDKLRRFVIVTSTCLFVLTIAASSLLMNPLTSFARSNQPNDAVTTPTATSTDAIIQSIQKTVGKVAENILATTDQATTTGGAKLVAGLALYLFTNDTATTSACTGACAKDWPPLLITGTRTLSQVSLGSHTLATVPTANGKQVTYDGHLLYTYSDDAADPKHAVHGQGDANGQWQVISPDAIIQSIQKTVGTVAKNILATTYQATTTGDTKLAAGLALYLFTNDTATTSACTGGCATNWPPLLITGTLSQVSLGSHTLATASTVHGTQVTCDGHLLYAFKNDVVDPNHAVHGQGTKWQVIKV